MKKTFIASIALAMVCSLGVVFPAYASPSPFNYHNDPGPLVNRLFFTDFVYSHMKGIDNLEIDGARVSDTADTLYVEYSCDKVAFDWLNASYMPKLTQMEVILSDGSTALQTYFTMEGEDGGWVSCRDTDTFKGSTVKVRVRAVCNPLGGEPCAYSAWSDWQDIVVDDGPAKGEQRIVDTVYNVDDLAQ